MHGTDIAVSEGVEQGMIVRNSSLDPQSPVELAPCPEGVAPKDWVLWHCYQEVQQQMIENKSLSEVKACEMTGWNYNTWRTAKKNPFALGMWAEVTGQAMVSFATYLRENLMYIGDALVERARDTKDPQGVQAAKVVLQELRKVQEDLEDVGDSGGPAISSAALLELGQRAGKATIRKRRKHGGVTEEVEVELTKE